jgi:hypothetical protein
MSKKARTRKPAAPICVLHAPPRRFKFTIPFAKKYLGLDEFEGERSISTARADAMEEKMWNGKYDEHQTTLRIAVCLWDKNKRGDPVERKLDGQHICRARLKLPANWDKTITVHKYAIRNPGHYKLVYSQFNSTYVRSPDQKAAIGVADSFKGYSLRAKKAAVTGMKAVMAPRSPSHVPTEDAVVLVLGSKKKLVETVLPIFKPIFTRSKERGPILKRFRKQGVYAGVLAVMHAHPRVGLDFFTRLVNQVSDGANDPVTRLFNYLGRLIAIKSSPPALVVANQVIRCFNARYEGRELQSMPRGLNNDLARVTR